MLYNYDYNFSPLICTLLSSFINTQSDMKTSNKYGANLQMLKGLDVIRKLKSTKLYSCNTVFHILTISLKTQH